MGQAAYSARASSLDLIQDVKVHISQQQPNGNMQKLSVLSALSALSVLLKLSVLPKLSVLSKWSVLSRLSILLYCPYHLLHLDCLLCLYCLRWFQKYKNAGNKTIQKHYRKVHKHKTIKLVNRCSHGLGLLSQGKSPQISEKVSSVCQPSGILGATFYSSSKIDEKFSSTSR